MVAERTGQLSPGISLQPKAKRENYMNWTTKRTESKQHPRRPLPRCISFLSLQADILSLERQKEEIAKAVTESLCEECLMNSHLLCSQHQDQMTIMWDISIRKNVFRLKNGSANPKQLFKHPGHSIIRQWHSQRSFFVFFCVRNQSEETSLKRMSLLRLVFYPPLPISNKAKVPALPSRYSYLKGFTFSNSSQNTIFSPKNLNT